MTSQTVRELPIWRTSGCDLPPGRERPIRGCKCPACEHRREVRRAWDRSRRADPEYVDRRRELVLNSYYGMSGSDYNRMLLRQRRRRALQRMEARNARRAVG